MEFPKIIIAKAEETIIGDDDQAIMDGFGSNSQAFLTYKVREKKILF